MIHATSTASVLNGLVPWDSATILECPILIGIPALETDLNRINFTRTKLRMAKSPDDRSELCERIEKSTQAFSEKFLKVEAAINEAKREKQFLIDQKSNAFQRKGMNPKKAQDLAKLITERFIRFSEVRLGSWRRHVETAEMKTERQRQAINELVRNGESHRQAYAKVMKESTHG